MPLLIKNGEIVTADTRYKADIFVEDETITAIGAGLEVPPDTEVIDAAGKYVFPDSSIRTSISTCPSWLLTRRIPSRPPASRP
jgi:hypothetical protein